VKKWLLWTSLGTLVVAVAVHIITVIAIPRIIVKKYLAKFPANCLLTGQKTTAYSATAIRPSPDLVYSVVCYDVSRDAVKLTAKVPTDTYWSVSCYQDNSDNFFVINNRQVKSNPAEILLVRQGMKVLNTGKATVVFSPTNRGILSVRHLLVSDDKYSELKTIQNESYLQIGDASSLSTVSTKEREN